MSKVNYGEVIIATPATHIVQLESEESLGTSILKGYNTGLLSFGQDKNLFQLVNNENQFLGLEVQDWGHYYPFGGSGMPRTTNLFISCKGWIAFEIDATNGPVWESWLTHFYPTQNETSDIKVEVAKFSTLNLPIPTSEQALVGPLIISMDISMCTPPVIDQVNAILKLYPGDREVHLKLTDGPKSTILKLDESLKVNSSSILSDNLKSILGPNCLSA
jgi:hypothetical protein